MSTERAKAKAAGDHWAEQYEHHLGMLGDAALSFYEFKKRTTRLLHITQKLDPHGKRRAYDQEIKQLSDQLGL